MTTPDLSDNQALDLGQLRPDTRLLTEAVGVTTNAALISVVVVAILSATLGIRFGLQVVLAWVTLVVAIQALRLLANRHIVARELLSTAPAVTFRVILSGSFLSGLGWGLALPMMGHNLPATWQLLVVTTIGGVASGAISTLGNSLVLLAAFITGAVVPASVWLISRGDSLSVVTGVLALVYGANLIMLGRGTSRRARALAQLAYENAGLARDLSHEKRAVDDANRDLRRALNRQRKVEAELREHHNSLAKVVEQQTADLVRARDIAEAGNRAKSEFLANISHELRTPMHAILSFATIGAGKASDSSTLHRYFRRIHESGNRLLLLINDLLDLSKLDSGQGDFAPAEVDPVAVLQCAYAEVESLFNDKQLCLQVERDPPVGEFSCFGDRRLLQQLFTNLLGNAIKFSPENTCITATVAWMECERHEGVVIGIQDQGVGIPEQELDHVFDRFAQSSATKTGAGGTGLGLAICRTIVDRHGGRLWAEPADQGALFRVWLPKTRSATGPYFAPEPSRSSTA